MPNTSIYSILDIWANYEKLVRRTFRKYSRTMRSQLGLFSRTADLAISLASERSKSFKDRRVGPHRSHSWTRHAEKTRARERDSRKIRLSNRTELGKREKEREWSRVRSDLFRSPSSIKYTRERSRRTFIQIAKLLYSFARGKPISKTAAKFTVKPFSPD